MNNPVLLSVLFRPTGDYHATLRIRSHNDAALSLTIIHDGVFGISTYGLVGDKVTDDLPVQDNENIVILASRESLLVGSAVFQVNTALADTHGLVLCPCSVHNMDVDQCDQSALVRAMNYSIDTVLAEAAVCLEEGTKTL